MCSALRSWSFVVCLLVLYTQSTNAASIRDDASACDILCPTILAACPLAIARAEGPPPYEEVSALRASRACSISPVFPRPNVSVRNALPKYRDWPAFQFISMCRLTLKLATLPFAFITASDLVLKAVVAISLGFLKSFELFNQLL